MKKKVVFNALLIAAAMLPVGYVVAQECLAEIVVEWTRDCVKTTETIIDFACPNCYPPRPHDDVTVIEKLSCGDAYPSKTVCVAGSYGSGALSPMPPAPTPPPPAPPLAPKPEKDDCHSCHDSCTAKAIDKLVGCKQTKQEAAIQSCAKNWLPNATQDPNIGGSVDRAYTDTVCTEWGTATYPTYAGSEFAGSFVTFECLTYTKVGSKKMRNVYNPGSVDCLNKWENGMGGTSENISVPVGFGVVAGYETSVPATAGSTAQCADVRLHNEDECNQTKCAALCNQ